MFESLDISPAEVIAFSECFLFNLSLTWQCMVQILQENLDTLHDQLDQEKSNVSQGKKDVESLVQQLAGCKAKEAEKEENMKRLQIQLDSCQEEIKVKKLYHFVLSVD